MHRYLAIHRLGGPAPKGAWKEELARLARKANDVGIHAVETFYSAERNLAYTLYDAPDVESLRRLHESAGLGAPDVLSAERVFTELLAEPRRDR